MSKQMAVRCVFQLQQKPRLTVNSVTRVMTRPALTDGGDDGRGEDDGVRPVPRVAVNVAGDAHTLARRLGHRLGG